MPKIDPFEISLPAGVSPIPGEKLRYLVDSRTPGKEAHLVDLEENGFNGACSCENFQFSRQKQFNLFRERGITTVTSRCFHIRKAILYHAELSMRIVAGKKNIKP